MLFVKLNYYDFKENLLKVYKYTVKLNHSLKSLIIHL